MRTAAVLKTTYNRDVYEPSDDTFALVDAFEEDAATWSSFHPAVTVELGSGSGFVITSVALVLQQLGIRSSLTAIDISEAAARATCATLSAHAVSGVDVLLGDRFSCLEKRLHRGIDLLLFNPPYVVTPDDEVDQGGIMAAWAGGKDGRVVIDRVLADLDAVLSSSGRMYMIAIQQNRPQQILAEVRARYGMHGRVLLTRRADEELISVLLISRLPLN